MPSFGAVFFVLGLIPRAPNFAKFHARGGGGLLWIAPRDRGPPGPTHFRTAKQGSREGLWPQRGGASGGGAPPGWAAVAHGAAVGGVWRGRGGNPRAHTGEKPGCRGRKRAVVPGNGAQPGAFRAASGSQHRAEAGKTGRRQGCAGGFWRGFQGAKRGQRGGKGGISGLKAAKRAGKALHTVGFGRKTGRSTTYFGRRVTGSRSLPTARALTRVQARFARI